MTPPHPAALPAEPGRPPRLDRALLWLFSVVLAVCSALFVVVTRHWLVVSDAALMQYTVFLIRHGWTPYRDLLDVNMPGAYLVTAAGMHLGGSLDQSWRLFDLGLVALAGAAYFVIARPYSKFAALFATALLLLVHGQDGIQQAGQRDLVMAVLLLAGMACLLEAVRGGRGLLLVPFGVASGLAATIKPTALPIALALLALCVAHRGGWMRPERAKPASLLAWTGLGLGAILLPIAAMLLWLAQHHALRDWLSIQRVLLPYYATLGRRSFGFTLQHSLSPLLPLILLWLLCLALCGRRDATASRCWYRFERLLLATVTVLSLLSLLAQGKALPYQRYPMLVFLLLLMALDFTTALRVRQPARVTALAALALGSLVLAPIALARAHRFVPTQEFKAMLAADLKSAGFDRSDAPHADPNPGPHPGPVQCIDSINECLPTLYSLGLEPATGTLYDIYLFGDPRQAAIQQGRQRFLAQLEAHPPAAVVVVSGLFFDTASGYGKLQSWPAFDAWLHQHYSLSVTRVPPHPVRWWSRPQPPAGYRFYLARDATAPVSAR